MGRSQEDVGSNVDLAGWKLCDLCQDISPFRASVSSFAVQKCKYKCTTLVRVKHAKVSQISGIIPGS